MEKPKRQTVKTSKAKVFARESFAVVLDGIQRIVNSEMDVYIKCRRTKEYIDTVDFLNTPIDGLYPPDPPVTTTGKPTDGKLTVSIRQKKLKNA